METVRDCNGSCIGHQSDWLMTATTRGLTHGSKGSHQGDRRVHIPLAQDRHVDWIGSCLLLVQARVHQRLWPCLQAREDSGWQTRADSGDDGTSATTCVLVVSCTHRVRTLHTRGRRRDLKWNDSESLKHMRPRLRPGADSERHRLSDAGIRGSVSRADSRKAATESFLCRSRSLAVCRRRST